MNSDETSRELKLSQTLVMLADTLVSDFDVADLLDRLVRGCVELVPAAAAGLMLADQRGRLRVMACSTEQSRLLELFELQNDEGPSLDCFRSHALVAVSDPAMQTARWPVLAAEARQQGFGPMYAMPLRLREECLGALTLLCPPAEQLGDEDLRIGQTLADMATIAILQHRALRRSEELSEQLQAALNIRLTIEQAKGVIAEQARVDMNAAFELLRDYARSSGGQLSEVADQIASGDIDPGGTRPNPTATQR
jgi:GAF domain-containing protein